MVCIGVDIVDNQRIRRMLSPSFINQFLSEEEKEEYHKISTENRQVEYIAGRLAAKEAVLKCFKTTTLCSMKKIVIKNDETGAPFVEQSS